MSCTFTDFSLLGFLGTFVQFLLIGIGCVTGWSIGERIYRGKKDGRSKE